jgi:hypothetical protein
MPGSQKVCKPESVEVLAVQGKGKAQAQKIAISTWSAKVTSTYGAQWASWQVAAQRVLECLPQRQHPNLWRCKAKARPCRYVQTSHSYEPTLQFDPPGWRSPRRPILRRPILRMPRTPIFRGSSLRGMPLRGMLR